MLYTHELVEATRTAITQAEDRYGKLPSVRDEVLTQWAETYASRRAEELIEQQFEAYATHEDFLTSEQQEDLHLKANTDGYELVIDELITRLFNIKEGK